MRLNLSGGLMRFFGKLALFSPKQDIIIVRLVNVCVYYWVRISDGRNPLNPPYQGDLKTECVSPIGFGFIVCQLVA